MYVQYVEMRENPDSGESSTPHSHLLHRRIKQHLQLSYFPFVHQPNPKAQIQQAQKKGKEDRQRGIEMDHQCHVPYDCRACMQAHAHAMRRTHEPCRKPGEGGKGRYVQNTVLFS